MRRLLLGAAIVVLGAACGAPTAPHVNGPCWVHVTFPGHPGIGLSLHYPACPSDSALNATLGPGRWTITPG